MLAKGRTIRSWGGRGRQILKTNSCTDFTGKKKILQMNSGGEKSYRASKDHQQKVFISCHKTKRSQSEDHLLYPLGNPTFRPIFTLQFRKICVIHFLGMGMRKRQADSSICPTISNAHRVLLTLSTLILTVRQFKLISLCDKNNYAFRSQNKSFYPMP